MEWFIPTKRDISHLRGTQIDKTNCNMLHCTIITITLQLLTQTILAANFRLFCLVFDLYPTLFLLQISHEHF
jgi:hypothetical protein